jgi:hypothetical protein
MHVLTGVWAPSIGPRHNAARSRFYAYNILVFKGIFPVAVGLEFYPLRAAASSLRATPRSSVWSLEMVHS